MLCVDKAIGNFKLSAISTYVLFAAILVKSAAFGFLHIYQ